MPPALAMVLILVLVAAVGAAPAAAGTTCTIRGTRSADVLRGGSGDDVICGGGGADIIYGGGGNDRLLGGRGRDRLLGGAGNDRLLGGRGRDRLYGGAGNDVISGGGGNDSMVGGAGDDSFIGGSGVDAVDFSGARRVSVNLARGTATGQGQDSIRLVEATVGSPGADVLVGDGSANRLFGGGGGDVLRGGSGHDVLAGEAGDDDMLGGADNDSLRGGPDDDVLDGGSGSDTCSGGTGIDIIKPTCDSTPPKVLSLSISPTAIDTSEGPARLVFEVRAVDGLAGVTEGGIAFRSPSRQYLRASWSAHDLVAGDAKDGVYRFELSVPRYAEQGTWHVKDVWARDAVGNTLSLWLDEQLQKAGLDRSFEQLGAGDVTAPRMRSLALSAELIDTGAGPAAVTVDARVTDNLAGVDYGRVTFRSPSGKQSVSAYLNEFSRVGGTTLDSLFQAEMTLPRYAEQGIWQVDFIAVEDTAGNSRSYQLGGLDDAGFRLKFEQTAEGDAIAPTLRTLSFSPTRIDTSESSATVVVEGRVTDNLSGFLHASITVCSPSRTQWQRLTWNTQDRVSGDAKDGVYRNTVVIPQYSAGGEWSVCRAHLDDAAQNRRQLNGAPSPVATFLNGS